MSTLLDPKFSLAASDVLVVLTEALIGVPGRFSPEDTDNETFWICGALIAEFVLVDEDNTEVAESEILLTSLLLVLEIPPSINDVKVLFVHVTPATLDDVPFAIVFSCIFCLRFEPDIIDIPIIN